MRIYNWILFWFAIEIGSKIIDFLFSVCGFGIFLLDPFAQID